MQISVHLDVSVRCRDGEATIVQPWSGSHRSLARSCGLHLASRWRMPNYTCPKHPDVQSDRPGNCNKCGARLEERTGSGQRHQQQREPRDR
jgi:hypothetical protein